MLISQELELDAASYFNIIIGILSWMIKLGRINIITKTSLLSSHLAQPRVGHFDAAVHVMAYVGQKYSTRLVCEPSYLEICHSVFKKCDWSEFYHDAEEVML